MRDIALITGASSGLGEELARLVAADGRDLVLVARRKEKLEALQEELQRTHKVRVDIIVCDLGSEGSIDHIMAELQKENCRVTLLVNNAGRGQLGTFYVMEEESIRSMINVNIAALTLLTRRILPSMVEARCGRILMIASTAAFEPGPLMAIYYASKAYVLSLSLALRNELKESGVNVTCLCPGPTRTEFAKVAGVDRSRYFQGLTMDAKAVAVYGYRAAKQGKALAVPGVRNKMFVFLTRMLPRSTCAAVARRIQEG